MTNSVNFDSAKVVYMNLYKESFNDDPSEYIRRALQFVSQQNDYKNSSLTYYKNTSWIIILLNESS